MSLIFFFSYSPERNDPKFLSQKISVVLFTLLRQSIDLIYMEIKSAIIVCAFVFCVKVLYLLSGISSKQKKKTKEKKIKKQNK